MPAQQNIQAQVSLDYGCRPEKPHIDPVGIGLRSAYYQDFLSAKPAVGWLEVHPENYFGGGTHRHVLDQIRNDYPLSLHGVGLSLGSAHGLNREHLKNFKELIDRYEPFMISDHASWSASGNAHLNDLLPLPYTMETLDILCGNINHAQDFFGRTILIENPSTYIAFKDNDMTEQDFMNAAASRTGCKILLDVNNIFVQSHNHGLDPYAYINTIKPEYVAEMHLAGHSERRVSNGEILLVDTHNKAVKDDVWDLFAAACSRFDNVPTLIEWDQDFPALSTLLREADKARAIIDQHKQKSA